MRSNDPYYYYTPPVLCDYCESYVDATCASFEKKTNEMTDQMIETMKARIAACSQCFNQKGRLIVSLILVRIS